jgi:hypothetical protein
MALAQEPASFVEVIVTDTAGSNVKRAAYVCSVHLDYPSYTEDPWEPGISNKEQKRRREKYDQAQDSLCADQEHLRSELVAKGFTLTNLANATNEYEVVVDQTGACRAGDVVDIRSLAELKRLVTFIRSKKNVSGSVLYWQTDHSAWDRGCVERLYQRAVVQASDLAAVASQKLGALIWAKETTETKPPGSIQWGARAVEPEPRRMTFRFELLPK